jgi:hypothetical protein
MSRELARQEGTNNPTLSLSAAYVDRGLMGGRGTVANLETRRPKHATLSISTPQPEHDAGGDRSATRGRCL